MEVSSSSEAASRSATQEFNKYFTEPEHSLPSSEETSTDLNRMNEVHIPLYFSKIHFNIISNLHLVFYSCPFLSALPNKNPVSIPLLPHAYPAHLIFRLFSNCSCLQEGSN
jgi:hypothetical protein